MHGLIIFFFVKDLCQQNLHFLYSFCPSFLLCRVRPFGVQLMRAPYAYQLLQIFVKVVNLCYTLSTIKTVSVLSRFSRAFSESPKPVGKHDFWIQQNYPCVLNKQQSPFGGAICSDISPRTIYLFPGNIQLTTICLRLSEHY